MNPEVAAPGLDGHAMRRAGVATLAVTALAIVLATWVDATVSARLGMLSSFVALSVPAVILVLPGWIEAARRFAERPGARWLVGLGAVAALVPERLARGSGADLATAAVYVAVVLAVTWPRRHRGTEAGWWDLVVVAAIWLPLELRWVGGDFKFLRLFGVDLVLYLFVVERGLIDPGRIVPVRRREFAVGVGAFLAFIAIAIPLAMATGFAAPGIADKSIGEWGLFVVATFWIIALPEELLYRGLMQGLLARVAPVPVALVLASVVFGLSHLNDGPADLRYVVLATLAGIAYGWAYLKTGNLAAPILTHFLVDILWRGGFAGLG